MKIFALSLLLALGVLPAVQGGSKCTNPKGEDGESYTEGCLKLMKDLLDKHMEQTDCDDDSPVSPSSLSTTMNQAHVTEGLVISGGFGSSTRSVEMFIPSTNHSCTLPPTPEERHEHTMSGLTICGGGLFTSHRTTCIQLSSGVWSVTHNLQEARYGHSSWPVRQGVILMGGLGGKSNLPSEVVGQGSVSFVTRYDTLNACAIPDEDSVLLTGGRYTKQRVSRYAANGYEAELPELNIGRENHGCGAFLRQDGTKVFLVAGGSNLATAISSTELMIENSDIWTITSPLPRALDGVRGVTLGNTFYMSGGLDENRNYRDEILAWSDEMTGWEEAGKMKEGRNVHAITTINVEDVAGICF